MSCSIQYFRMVSLERYALSSNRNSRFNECLSIIFLDYLTCIAVLICSYSTQSSCRASNPLTNTKKIMLAKDSIGIKRDQTVNISRALCPAFLSTHLISAPGQYQAVIRRHLKVQKIFRKQKRYYFVQRVAVEREPLITHSLAIK